MNTSLAVIPAPIVPTSPAEERAHHPYSPSTLQMLEACPAYIGKQSDTPHPRTLIGTKAHEGVETGEDNNSLADDDAALVAECIDFLAGIKQRFVEKRNEEVEALALERWGKETPPNQPADVEVFAEQNTPQILEIREDYLPVDDYTFADGTKTTTGGYIDYAILNPSRTYAEMVDFKFGLWPVEVAENNLQGIAYCLGLFKRFPTLEKIEFFFKQPAIENLTSHVFTRANSEALYLRVQVVVARARAARESKSFETARPHLPACNFCANIGTCPKVAEFACRVGAKFYPLEIPASITPTEVHNAKDTSVGLRLASVMEAWAKAFKATITDRVLRRDSEVPAGYKLQTRATRKIIDRAKYKEAALAFLSPEQYDETLEPALGKVEDLISESAPRGQKKARVEEFGEIILANGAVEKSAPYTFLMAEPKKKAE